MVDKIKNKRRRDPNPDYKSDGSGGPRMLKRSGRKWISQAATVGGAHNITYDESRKRATRAALRRDFFRKHGPKPSLKVLRSLASEAHIAGRSKMNWEELVEALTQPAL